MPQIYGYDKAACTGCGACGEICPISCISMRPDAEGFLYPQVDSGQCTGCGRCGVVCQAYNRPEWPESTETAHICRLTDGEAAQLLFELSRRVIADGGAVFGPSSASPFGTVCDVLTDQEEAQAPEGSEYIESREEGAYALAKSILEAGRKVLYCAAPCHIAGLRSFLGKEYEGLCCYTRVCCGVSGAKVLGRYLGCLEEALHSKATGVRLGHGSKTVCVLFETGDSHCAAAETDPFLMGMTEGLFLRPSCHACPFAGRADTGDIVLAPHVPARAGGEKREACGSFVFLNTQKGEELFARSCTPACRPEAEERGRYPLKRPPAPHKNRADFFKEFESGNFSLLVSELTAPTGMTKAWLRLRAACGDTIGGATGILSRCAAAPGGSTAVQRLLNILRRVFPAAHGKKP